MNDVQIFETPRVPDDQTEKKLIRIVFVSGGYEMKSYSFKESRWFTISKYCYTRLGDMDRMWLDLNKRLLSGYVMTDIRKERK